MCVLTSLRKISPGTWELFSLSVIPQTRQLRADKSVLRRNIDRLYSSSLPLTLPPEMEKKIQVGKKEEDS